MKKAILVCLIIAGFMFIGCESPADSGGDVDIPDNRFVGKWAYPGDVLIYEFLDSSNFIMINNFYGWTGTGTYTFDEVRIYFKLEKELDGIYPSWYTDYVLTDTYLDLPKIDRENDPTGGGRFYKQ